MKYFYLNQENKPQGPHDEAELQGLLQNQIISLSTLIAAKGSAEWAALGDVLPGVGNMPSEEVVPENTAEPSAVIPSVKQKKNNPPFLVKFMKKVCAYTAALVFIVAAIGAVLYNIGVIEKSMFQTREVQYIALIDEMIESKSVIDTAVKDVNGSTSAQKFIELSEEQIETLSKIRQRFSKLGIPVRDIQLKLQKKLGLEDQLKSSKPSLKQENGTNSSVAKASYEYNKNHRRIIEDYLMSDEDFKKNVKELKEVNAGNSIVSQNPRKEDVKAGDSTRTITVDQSEIIDNICYEINQEVPYTGIVVAFYGSNEKGQKRWEINFNQGKRHGKRTKWYENGNREQEENYKDGKLHGMSIDWYESGQKKQEANAKEGKAHGLWTSWHENGKKNLEWYYKDGKQHGIITKWYESGQKESEANYKEGKLHGPYTQWDQNGRKIGEGNYVNDILQK